MQSTDLIDAAMLADAAPPPVCPAIGTLPTFSGEFRQLPTRNCSAYVPSTDGSATAICDGAIARGPIDAELVVATVTPAATPYALYGPRIAPEGDRLFVQRYISVAPWFEMVEFQLVADTWTQRAVYSGSMTLNTLSTPSRGPNRRIVYETYNPQTFIAELVELVSDDAGTWTKKPAYPVTELGVPNITEPSLSADGLRLVFVEYGNETTCGGGRGDPFEPTLTTSSGYDLPVYYADRATVDDKFGMAQKVATVPSFVRWPHLTEDCGRIYFSALNTVFYMKQ